MCMYKKSTFMYKEEIIGYIKSKIKPLCSGDSFIVRGDRVFVEECTGALKRVVPLDLIPLIYVQRLEMYGFLKIVQDSLVKKYVKKASIEIDFYAGKYGKGFTLDLHNPESKNFAKRKYFVWQKEKVPDDGYVILLNGYPQGMEGREILKNVFHRFDNGERFLEVIIGKDILQIYAVKNF